MCGIAGWITENGAPKHQMQSVGEVFATELLHRGPDGYGIEVFGEDLGVALLVHRRLSILGLGEAGAQPMISADGRYAISFNGEIYNYLELAEEHGLSNLSGTDTEILLQLWQDLGRAVLDKLDGFFAMAIWDNAEKTLTLVRDRTGVKPIYYCCNAHGFWFGSEEFALVKAMELVGETTKLNTNALQAHSLRGDSDSQALYEGIQVLAAGEYLVWRGVADMEIGLWHSGNYIPLNDVTAWVQKMGLKEVPATHAELLREQLKWSMKRRLRSDVPMGFAVSGGLDSAALVGVARGLLGKEAHVHVFSVISPGSEADESDYQQQVVKAVGGIWHTVDVSDLDAHDLERYIRATHRIPVAWNNIAHFALCEKVHEAGVKVLFNGQGADELFGGYPHYYKAAFWSERGTLWPQRKKWPLNFFTAGKQWLKYWLGIFKGQKYEDCADVLMRTDYYGSRLNQLLRYEDRNGMAWGLESRNPFADNWLMADAWLNAWADDTNSLKGSLSSKLVNGYSKGYLRKAMEGLVPESVLWRVDKKGFSVPASTMTLSAMIHWEKWILSDRLDNISGRGQRQKALARARKIAQTNEMQAQKSTKHRQLSPKEDALIAQLFRWAAVGCFLEVLHPNTPQS